MQTSVVCTHIHSSHHILGVHPVNKIARDTTAPRVHTLATIDPDHPFHWHLYCVHLYCLRIHCRYYFIWILIDNINNFAGLGFNGYDKLGRTRWDMVTNVYVWDVELALNMRDIATRWNALTSNWMRR